MFVPLELSLVLAAGASSLQLVLQLRILFVEVFLKNLVNIALSLLVLTEHLLEVSVTLSHTKLVLEVGEFVLLLCLLDLLELLSLNCFFSFIRSQVFLQLALDLCHGIIHLLLLLRLDVRDVFLDFIKRLNDLLALLATGIKLASKKLILTGLILLHNVFNILHLVLQLIDQASDFFTTCTLFLEDVSHCGTLVVSAVDLLLKHSILLAFEIQHCSFSVVIELRFKLRVFDLAPVL